MGGAGPAIRLKEVVYTLSPFQQSVMSGLFKDMPAKTVKRFSDNWFDAMFFIVPFFGTMKYASDYKEKEKMAHRY